MSGRADKLALVANIERAQTQMEHDRDNAVCPAHSSLVAGVHASLDCDKARIEDELERGAVGNRIALFALVVAIGSFAYGILT